MRKVRLAIVDDSVFVRKALQRIFENERRIVVVGLAESGEELLARLPHWQPDCVILDLSLPGLGGLETLVQILQWKPIPVIVFSSHTKSGAPITVEALHH